MLTDNARPPAIVNVSEEGINLILDLIRDKQLSISRDNIMFGIDHKNISGKRWMKLAGCVVSVSSGYKVPRNATITAMTIQTANIVEEARFNIRTNNQIVNLHSANLTTTKDLVEDNLNIDINKGDYIQLFLSVLNGTVDYPVVNIEVAWR